MNKKYKKALIIGRFQPFHKGHLYLIKEALTFAEKVVIGIGSANITDQDNPYSVEERLEMLTTALRKAGLENKVEKIVTIDDHPSDDVWLRLVLDKVADFDSVMGYNDWVSGIFKNAGYNVVDIPYYKRHVYEGKKIRAKLRLKNLLK